MGSGLLHVYEQDASAASRQDGASMRIRLLILGSAFRIKVSVTVAGLRFKVIWLRFSIFRVKVLGFQVFKVLVF